MNRYAVALAGGSGKRLFPLSQDDIPKQLLPVNGVSLLEQTFNRIGDSVEDRHKFITTVEEQRELYEGYPQKRIIEPMRKNTGASVAYSCMNIVNVFGDGIVGIFPSDHYVAEKDEAAFQERIEEAYQMAEETGEIILLGVKPTYPATGHGYIKSQKGKVTSFIEKPPKEWADIFYESHLWSAGIYIGPIRTFIEEYLQYQPEIVHLITSGFHQEIKEEVYSMIEDISVDKAIAEKSKRLRVIGFDGEWSDVGNLDRFGDLYEKDRDGNSHEGEHQSIESENVFTHSEKDIRISTIGVKDLCVIQRGKEIVVCHREEAEKVRKIEGRKESE